VYVCIVCLGWNSESLGISLWGLGIRLFSWVAVTPARPLDLYVCMFVCLYVCMVCCMFVWCVERLGMMHGEHMHIYLNTCMQSGIYVFIQRHTYGIHVCIQITQHVCIQMAIHVCIQITLHICIQLTCMYPAIMYVSS